MIATTAPAKPANIMEALTREIERVAVIRERYALDGMPGADIPNLNPGHHASALGGARGRSKQQKYARRGSSQTGKVRGKCNVTTYQTNLQWPATSKPACFKAAPSATGQEPIDRANG
jgi:hypothetical protein